MTSPFEALHPRAQTVITGQEGFLVCVCSQCGNVEGEEPQAGCCSRCGIASEVVYGWAIVNHRVLDGELARLRGTH